MRLALREALAAFRRAPLLSLLGVTTIAFSLFAVGLFGLVALNIRQALQSVEERVEIRAFVADGTPAESTLAAIGELNAMREVQRAELVTQEQALARARRELGEFSDVFDASFLPASIDVRLRPGMHDPATTKRVAQRLRDYSFVDDVRYGEEWVEKLYHIRNIAAATGIALGLAFAAVAAIIIGATIRVSVLARSREISIMRLVGATNGFIRLPFLLDGFAKGVLGGLLAVLMTWIASRLVNHYILDTVFFDPRQIVWGVLGGAVIGLLGSALSVGRHLQKV